MAEQTGVRKLLVLHGPTLESQGILAFLREHFDVKVAGALDEALEAMREGSFSAVLAETADFLPLERGVALQQASVVLDTIGDGVCIVGAGGELVWSNRRLRTGPTDLLDDLRKLCREAYEQFATAGARAWDRGKRYSLIRPSGDYYEVICSPVRDREGILRQVVSVVVNATSQRRQQIKLNAIDMAGRELVRLDDDVNSQKDAAQRLQMLQERIIRYSRDVLDYQHFIVFLLDEQTNRLESIFSEGVSPGKLEHEIFASAEGNGTCGYVAATGRSYICHDVRTDPHYVECMDGACSSLTVPLRLHDKIIGVLNVESARVGAFSEEDRQFAEIFANYVAVALHMLNLLVFERRTAHDQVSGSISAELSGPLNDIATEAGELMEDYIGHDDIRKRLGAIIDRAAEARQIIRRLTEAPATGVWSMPSTGAAKDPILAGRRILIVDDEDLIRQTIRDVLSPHGCCVDVACNGAEAITLIQTNGYDLVISDIKMPGASGYDVFAAAKAANPQTKVILITAFGYDPNHSVVRASQEGLDAVLMKPFKVQRLLDECRIALTP